MTLLSTAGGRLYRAATKAIGVERKVAVFVDRRDGDADRPGPAVKLLIAYVTDERIVRSELIESR